MVKVITDDADFSFTTLLPQPKSLMPQGFSRSVVVWYFSILSSKKEKRKNNNIYKDSEKIPHRILPQRDHLGSSVNPCGETMGIQNGTP